MKFKPLEWRIYESGYIVQPLGFQYKVWQSPFADEIWRLRIGVNGSVIHFPSESEAKAFAQKDFESKVMKYIIKK